MPVITETERLLLRTWKSGDASDAFAIWGDPEVMRYVGKPFANLDAARRALQSAAAAQERHGVSLWAVVEKATGEIVGACGFHFVAEGPELELAYHFKPPHWGKGYATEATNACLRYAAQVLAPTRIIAGVEVGNTASRRVLEKTGCIDLPTRFDHGCRNLDSSPGFLIETLTWLDVDEARHLPFNDPFDCLIVGTAIRLNSPLITKDEAIVESKLVETVW